jgi:hypothetical protein
MLSYFLKKVYEFSVKALKEDKEVIERKAVKITRENVQYDKEVRNITILYYLTAAGLILILSIFYLYKTADFILDLLK